MKSTVTVEWVKKHVGDKGLRVLDSRPEDSFAHSHVPTAVHAHLFHYFVPGTDARGLVRFHRDLSRMLGKLGLEASQKPVVYERGFGMMAARVAWMLQYAGMKDVSILEGGFRAWRKAGYPVENGPVHPSGRIFHVEPKPGILATAESIVGGPNRNRIVLDVRSRGEYEGSEKRDCCARSGRIPGAVWLEWTQFLRDDQGFLRGPSITSRLKQAGIAPGKEIVTYCHRGARAASVFYALKALGFRRVRNYVGSWHEWSSKPELPVETSVGGKP